MKIKQLLKKVFARFSRFKFVGPNSVFHVRKGNSFLNPRYMSIGDNVLISKNCIFECYPKGLSNSKSDPSLQICDGVSIRSNAHIQCASSIIIGKDTMISDYVYMCDYNHGVIPDKNGYHTGKLETSPISIGNGCWVGHGATILKGVTIGDYSVIGANSVVTKSFPDYCMIAGNPAKIIKMFDQKSQKWLVV
jgi:acetyltransferase-like isoleucine patch superfamily enzyme